MTHPSYGFTLLGTLEGHTTGMFPSGIMFEKGALALIIPPKGVIRDRDDWVPVWETAEQAGAALARLSHHPATSWRVESIHDNMTAGGPGARKDMFRGVEGWIVPARVLPTPEEQTAAYLRMHGLRPRP